MRVKKSDWYKSQSNPKALRQLRSPSESSSQRIMYRNLPRILPGRGVVFESSHSCRKTVRWLISKGFHESLRKIEIEILLLASAGYPDWLFNIIDFLVRENENVVVKRFIFRQGLNSNFFKLVDLEVSRRFLKSFRPSLEIYTVWVKTRKLPPSPYIGIGYSDHGSLGTGLAWQEQMLSDSEELDLFDLSNQLLSLRP